MQECLHVERSETARQNHLIRKGFGRGALWAICKAWENFIELKRTFLDCNLRVGWDTMVYPVRRSPGLQKPLQRSRMMLGVKCSLDQGEGKAYPQGISKNSAICWSITAGSLPHTRTDKECRLL